MSKQPSLEAKQGDIGRQYEGSELQQENAGKHTEAGQNNREEGDNDEEHGQQHIGHRRRRNHRPVHQKY